jgi:hypothetical protein
MLLKAKADSLLPLEVLRAKNFKSVAMARGNFRLSLAEIWATRQL